MNIILLQYLEEQKMNRKEFIKYDPQRNIIEQLEITTSSYEDKFF